MKRFYVVVLLWCIGNSVLAQTEKPDFSEYLTGVKQEAIAQGINASVVNKALGSATQLRHAIKKDKNQPERVSKMTLDIYLKARISEWKIALARRYYRQHYAVLHKIGAEYGIQPRFLVALWGNETNFGHYTGKTPIISALATLAYEGRREAFFRSQLIDALRILDQKQIAPDQFIGSWAGAFGQIQFMPASYLAYAVDFDGDGHKNIWTSLPDAFASAANYLHQNHWNEYQTWGREVKASVKVVESYQGKTLAMKAWQALGVHELDGKQLPSNGLKARMVTPDGASGRVFLVLGNYARLLDWNRSHYFAISIGILADEIIWPPVAGLPDAVGKT